MNIGEPSLAGPIINELDRDSSKDRVPLLLLAWTFLRIGATAFGGFMALVSVVRNIVVERKKLLRDEELMDGISLATILPGPVAINVVAYVGYKLRGGIGAVVCATAVILPSFVLLVGFSIAYLEWGQLPVVDKAVAGFVPAVAAIILNAAWGMRKQALAGVPEILIAVVAGGLMVTVGGFYLTLGIVIGSGLLGLVLFAGVPPSGNGAATPKPRSGPAKAEGGWAWGLAVAVLLGFLLLFLIPIPGLSRYPGADLFVTFSGMSLILFGGGFVFIPLIQSIVVEGLQWVSQTEFASAIALGQITPGPILISAAFIGYKVHGLLGAFVATFAIFFPPALLMVTASRALEKINHSPIIQRSLRGIRAAVLGLIASAALVVGQTAQAHWASAAILAATLIALIRFRVEVALIIPAAGLAGLILF
jgi:chromate transporter